MTEKLCVVLCKNNLAKGFADVRRYVQAGAVTINGEVATEWNQLVETGDVIKLGKHKSVIV